MSEITLNQIGSLEILQEPLIINEFSDKILNQTDEELRLKFLVQDLFLEHFFP